MLRTTITRLAATARADTSVSTILPTGRTNLSTDLVLGLPVILEE